MPLSEAAGHTRRRHANGNDDDNCNENCNYYTDTVTTALVIFRAKAEHESTSVANILVAARIPFAHMLAFTKPVKFVANRPLVKDHVMRALAGFPACRYWVFEWIPI